MIEDGKKKRQQQQQQQQQKKKKRNIGKYQASLKTCVQAACAYHMANFISSSVHNHDNLAQCIGQQWKSKSCGLQLCAFSALRKSSNLDVHCLFRGARALRTAQWEHTFFSIAVGTRGAAAACMKRCTRPRSRNVFRARDELHVMHETNSKHSAGWAGELFFGRSFFFFFSCVPCSRWSEEGLFLAFCTLVSKVNLGFSSSSSPCCNCYHLAWNIDRLAFDFFLSPAKMSITNIHAREIFDSRGNPTVEVDLHTSKGTLWSRSWWLSFTDLSLHY